MKKYISKLTMVVVIITLILASFILGAYASGNSVKDKIMSTVSSDIGAIAHQKKTVLLENIDAVIEERVISEKSVLIQQKGIEAEDELQEYFDNKITALIGTPEYSDLDDEIEDIKIDVVGRYKAEIDAAFNGK